MRAVWILPLALAVPVLAAPAKQKAPAKSAPKTAAKPAAKPAAAKPLEPQLLNLGGVTAQVPGEWKAQAPAGQFRLAQYGLPKAGNDTGNALLLVFHFGKGGGGSVEDNIKRWMGMMAQPDGVDVRKVAKRATLERPKLRITTLELPGTYLDKPFPFSQDITERPNYRMLAAIVETTDEAGEGPFYLRIVGPTKTVEAAKPGWEKLIASLKAE
jgi:hypothetical protein